MTKLMDNQDCHVYDENCKNQLKVTEMEHSLELKKYDITYWQEINDVCTDCEDSIYAVSEGDALLKMKERNSRATRISATLAEQPEINFRMFTLQQLKNAELCSDLHSTIPKDLQDYEFIGVGDCIKYKVDEGSENLYLRITVYRHQQYEPLEIQLWTKEDHEGLKRIIIELIKQI